MNLQVHRSPIITYQKHGYDDITAELYDLWFGNEVYEDYAFYKQHINQMGGAALEIGSGTGRLLVPLLQEGLNVNGIEPSIPMNSACFKKASVANLEPIIFQQYMEKLNISESYKTIFVPLCLFQMVVERDIAFEVLRRFYLHMERGGRLLISLFVPGGKRLQNYNGMWRVRQTVTRPSDNATIIFSESTTCDLFEQQEVRCLKYEICKQDDDVVTYIKTTRLRWYHKYEFMMMLEKIGFQDIFICGDYTNKPASCKSEILVYSALR